MFIHRPFYVIISSMIRNLIFDMGNVLIDFVPEHFMDKEGVTDKGDREILLRELFHSKEWLLADSGKIKAADICEICSERIPERLHEVSERLVLGWFDPLVPVPGMEEFVRKNKAEGRGIYMLSNAPDTAHQYVRNVPAIECFDGIVISSDIDMEKPHPEIFEYICEKYGMKAEECLFIDDIQANIDGAEAAGMKGFLFTGDVDALWMFVKKQ